MKGSSSPVGELSAVGTEIELSAFLKGLAIDYGFTYFLLVDIPSAGDEQLSPRIVMSDLPPGFLEDYDALGLLRNSPVFANLRRSTAPMIRNNETLERDRPVSEIDPAYKLFTKHALRTSVFFPVHGPNGARAALGFLGDRAAITHSELGELGISVMYAYDAYSNLKSKNGCAIPLLTPRELELVHWAANGKTSAEIAAIVSLSDHTINAYVNSAMRKLDCVNRTQLVAKALRLHLIS